MIDDATLARISRGELDPASVIGRVAFDPSDQAPNLLFLYGIARGMNPKKILEIGTSDGTTTLALLKVACEVGGQLTSIDVGACPIAEQLVDHYQMRASWRFIQGDSHEVLPRLKAQGDVFDVVLIDGDHSYHGCKRDFEDSVSMLTPAVDQGLVFIHDSLMVSSDHDWTKPHGSKGLPGCGLFVRDLFENPEWSVVLFPFGCAMAIVRRRSACAGAIDRITATARDQGLLP